MTTAAHRKPRLTIISPDLSSALRYGVAIEGLFEPTMVHSSHMLRDSIRIARAGTECMVTFLRRDASVVDVRELLDAADGTPIVFLAEEMPLRPPVARLIDAAGDRVLAASEAVPVVEATIVALLAARKSAHG